MELNLLQKQAFVVHDSFLYIRAESGCSEKKKNIKENLRYSSSVRVVIRFGCLETTIYARVN